MVSPENLTSSTAQHRHVSKMAAATTWAVWEEDQHVFVKEELLWPNVTTNKV